MPKIRLFCIPYAGGLAMAYNGWKARLGDHVVLVPIELAGRGSRQTAPLYRTFDEAVDDVYDAVRSRVDDLPYALLGHSMGSWLAYELSYRISASGDRPPVHLFLSGRRAPTIPHAGPLLYTLPDDDLVLALEQLGGISSGLFADVSMRELFLGIVRADLKITETYEYVDRGRLIETPVTVLSGKTDSTISVRDLLAWRALVAGPCSIGSVDGGHFFITQNIEGVTRVINQTMERYVHSVPV